MNHITLQTIFTQISSLLKQYERNVIDEITKHENILKAMIIVYYHSVFAINVNLDNIIIDIKLMDKVRDIYVLNSISVVVHGSEIGHDTLLIHPRLHHMCHRRLFNNNNKPFYKYGIAYHNFKLFTIEIN